MKYCLLFLLILTTALPPVQAHAQAEAPAAASPPPAIRVMTPEEKAEYARWVKEASALSSARNWASIEPIARRMLARDEATFGPEHPRTSNTTNWLADLLTKRGAHAEAEPFYRKALAIREKELGPTHPATAASVNNLAMNLREQDRLAEAETIQRRAIAIVEQVSGPDHPYTAISISNLATNLQAQGRLKDAEPLLKRALAIMEKAVGEEHAYTATSINNLAGNLYYGGRLGEAEPLLRRALAIREKVLGPEHSDTAISLDNLAENFRSRGLLNEAELLQRRALAIHEKASGPDHPSTAISLSNLALNLRHQGRLREAEPLAWRALTIFEKVLGVTHHHTVTSLNNVAVNLQSQGRLGEAEQLQRRSLTVFEKALGKEHPVTATSFNNLASNLLIQSRPSDAEPLHRQALAIRSKLLGPEHPETANSLNNLASSLQAQGRPGEAESFNRRALAARMKSLGPKHPDVANSLNNLAESLRAQGRLNEAEPFLQDALEINEELLGKAHEFTAITAVNLGTTTLDLRKPDLALKAARQALVSRRAVIHREGQAVDEASQGRLQTDSVEAAVLVQRAAWSVAENGGDVAALRAEAFDAAQTAGGSGAGRALTRSTARASLPATGQELVHDWEGLLSQRTALDDQLTRAAGASGSEADRKRQYLTGERVRLDKALGDAEQRLRTAHADYFDLINPQPVSLEALRTGTKGREALLRETEALILITPGITDKRTALQTGLVFVVTREGVDWAELGLGFSELNQAITRMRESLDPGSTGSRAPDGGGNGFTGRGFDRAMARRLYQAIFGAPEIAKLLAGKDEWLITPQGPLLSLPFAALVADEYQGADNEPAALRATRWLGLEKAVTILPEVSNLQALRGTDRPVRAADQPFFGIGDPDFARSRAETRTEVAMAPADTGQPRGMRSYFRDATGDPASIATLAPLPGTRMEIQALAQSLGASPTSYLLGNDATERQLRERNASGALGAARVVAFATHGLVSGDLKGTLAQPALALTPPAAGTPTSSEDDGLLTAGEAATLRLSADWVILSACNTAAGSGGKGAQGLTGLARAFFYAGADTLLVSHWRVGDAAATRLTTRAVEIARTGKGLSRAAALRESMRELMKDTALDGGNHSMSLAHPGVWAPFTLVGTER